MDIFMKIAAIVSIILALPLIALSLACWGIILGLFRENLLDLFDVIKSKIPLLNRE